MKYVKTFEQLEEFYLQNNSVYIIVDEDENWVLGNKPEGGCWSGCEAKFRFNKPSVGLVTLPHIESNIFLLTPLDNTGNWMSDSIHNSKKEAEKYLESILSSKIKFPHGYYMAQRNYKKFKDMGGDHIISLSKKYPNGILPIFVTDTDNPNYPKVETEVKDSLVSGHPVVDMKFKIVEYQMGFQKKDKLNF